MITVDFPIQILELLKDGYTCTNKPIMERMSFGSQLQKMISEFTQHFIPHMEEEEEIFQPLLMKYFAYEELRLLKEQVIQEHEMWKERLVAQKETAENMLVLLNSLASDVIGGQHYPENLQSLVDLTCENLQVQQKIEPETWPSASFNDLPEEMIINIFSYLNPQERTRCAQVSKHWNVLVYSPQLWRTIYPTNWARGFYDFQYRDPYTLVETEWSRQSMLDDDDNEDGGTFQAEKEIRSYER